MSLRISRRRSLALTLLALLLCAVSAGGLAGGASAEPTWTTYHRDPGRSGNDPDASEPITPALDWQSPTLDGPIWGQPLILGSRVYVGTVANEVYALNAATGKVIWEKNAGTPVPDKELCGYDVEPTVGIVGTPVIDVAKNAIYALADTWNATKKEAHHVLVGYDLTTGENVLTTQVDPPGTNPKLLLQRPALTLDEGNVLVGFGGNSGDCGIYRGAVASVPESGGPPSFWQYTPAPPGDGGGAVWGTSGPAVDSEGHVYVSTGNPNFAKEQKITTYDDSDSVIELNASMALIGNFEPATWLFDSNNDLDLSSSGPELLPGGLFFQAGKNEMGYLVQESTMGEGAAAVYGQKVCKGVKAEQKGEGSFGGDAYANGTIYVPCADGTRALTYNQAARTFSVLWHGPSDAFGPPIVSGGLVWVVSGKFLSGGGTKLYGLEPATGVARYTETLPSPVIDHFPSPSAAGGRLFVATGASVSAFRISSVLPELGRCAASTPTTEGKVKIYHGGFTDKGCTAVSEAKSGKYEWSSGPGAARQLAGTIGKATLETIGKAKITCTGGTSSGEVTSVQSQTTTLTFTGCELSTPKASCHSEGAGAGEVRTSPLEGELGFIAKAAPTVGWDLSPAFGSGSVVARLSCGETSVAVTGSVVAPVTALEKMSASFKVKYKGSKAKQSPERLENWPADTLSVSLSGKPAEAAALTATSTVTGKEPLEIKARP
jgi:outer membrane protein assembly factor BamB